MDGFQLGIILDLAFKVHLPEHIQRRLLTSIFHSRATLLLNRASQLPAIFTAQEAVCFTVL